jgi:hypothetical protein
MGILNGVGILTIIYLVLCGLFWNIAAISEKLNK